MTFEYQQASGSTYSLGYGEFGFEFHVSECGPDSVYVLRDPIHAVGLNRSGTSSRGELAAQLTPGRSVVAKEGEQVILQNTHGALCLVDIQEVQRETTSPAYLPASVRFQYRILVDS